MAQSYRIRARLCREGSYFLFVLLFIIGSAVFRDVNLLYLLAGMMIGPLLFNWRLVMVNLRKLEFKRQVPDHVCAGETLQVHVSGKNGRRWLDSWAIAVKDRIEKTAGPMLAGDDGASFVTVMLPRISVKQPSGTNYQLRITRRGRYRLGPLSVSTRYPFGLVDELVVFPALGSLTRHWSHWMETDFAGTQNNARRQGISDGDYYGLREWRSGDSTRWIHWRTSARTGKLSVKQFEQQRGNDIAFLLDLWVPDQPTEEDLGRVEMAVSFAATIVHDVCQRGRRRLLVTVAGHEIKQWNDQSSQKLKASILTELATLQGTSRDKLEEALVRHAAAARPGARRFVISTRRDRLESLQPAINDAVAVKMTSELTWLNVGSEQVEHYFRLGNE